MKNLLIFATSFFLIYQSHAAVIITDVDYSYVNVGEPLAGHSVSPVEILARGYARPPEEDKAEIWPEISSHFLTTFTLTSNHNFTISLALDSYSDFNDYDSQSYVGLINTDTGEYILGALSQASGTTAAGDDYVTDYAVGSLIVSDRTFLLGPGNYELIARALSPDYISSSLNGERQYSSYQLEATFAVPAPPSIILFISALVGISFSYYPKLRLTSNSLS